MRKPKTAWEVAVMTLDRGLTIKGLCILGLIAEHPYISSIEIQEKTGWSRNTVNDQLRKLVKSQFVGARTHKGMSLYKLVEERFTPFYKYLCRATSLMQPCHLTHIKVLASIERDPHQVIYEIAADTGISEKVVKNALTDIFRARILAKRCRQDGYKFLPLLTILQDVSK